MELPAGSYCTIISDVLTFFPFGFNIIKARYRLPWGYKPKTEKRIRTEKKLTRKYS